MNSNLGDLLYVDSGMPTKMFAHKITIPMEDRPNGTPFLERQKAAQRTARKEGFRIEWIREGENYAGYYRVL